MGKFIDRTGQRFGRLVVIGLATYRIRGGTTWRCRCDCGREKIARSADLSAGDVTTCGAHRGLRFIDLTGQRFGELVVIGIARHKIRGRPAWRCLCDCGREKTAAGDTLRAGDVTTCGAHRSARFLALHSAPQEKKRKYPIGSDTNSRIYTIWRAMKMRCYSRSHKALPRYGGAGIVVCDEWQHFEGFRQWALASGYAPTLTLDRVDNERGYEPSNCRWATRFEQSRNRRRPILSVMAFGETKAVIDWAKDPRCTIGYTSLLRRLAKGISPEAAITRQKRKARATPDEKGRPG